VGNEDAESQPIPDKALSGQVIDDTELLIRESVDKTIIEAYEEKYHDSKPYPPLHGKSAVYFHIGRSSTGWEPLPTVYPFI
jgi:hypothetical protein